MPGRGGRTCKTRLTLPAGSTGENPAESTGDPAPEVPATPAESTGENAPKYRRLSAGETLLTLRKGADAPGLSAGSSAQTPSGSATDTLGGVAHELVERFKLEPPAAPARSRDEILAELRARFQSQGKWAHGRATNEGVDRRGERRTDDRAPGAK